MHRQIQTDVHNATTLLVGVIHYSTTTALQQHYNSSMTAVQQYDSGNHLWYDTGGGVSNILKKSEQQIGATMATYVCNPRTHRGSVYCILYTAVDRIIYVRINKTHPLSMAVARRWRWWWHTSSRNRNSTFHRRCIGITMAIRIPQRPTQVLLYTTANPIYLREYALVRTSVALPPPPEAVVFKLGGSSGSAFAGGFEE